MVLLSFAFLGRRRICSEHGKLLLLVATPRLACRTRTPPISEHLCLKNTLTHVSFSSLATATTTRRTRTIFTNLYGYHGSCPFSSAPIPRSPPPMFDYAVRRSFPQVLERAQSHPKEASFLHPRGWTTLHCCVEYDAPMEVIKAVHQAYPEALFKVDYRGQTPLDLALSKECKEYLLSHMQIIQQQEQQEEMEDEKDEEPHPTNNISITTTHGTAVENINQQELDREPIRKHIDKLSIQVANLQALCESLQQELDELKEKLE